MQTSPDDYAVIGRELGLFLRRWHRAQGRQAEAGLDRAAYLLLGRLVADGPARLTGIAAEMCVDASVVSRQASALEAAGLVVRTPDPGDRRASLIAPTEHGAEMFAAKKARLVALLHDLLVDWTDAERAEFAHLLSRLNAALAAREIS